MMRSNHNKMYIILVGKSVPAVRQAMWLWKIVSRVLYALFQQKGGSKTNIGSIHGVVWIRSAEYSYILINAYQFSLSSS